METKTCTKCGETKPLSEFHKEACKKDGHRNQCKVCTCANSRKYAAEHKEERAAYKREWVAENREHVNARNRAYRAANPHQRDDNYLRYTYGITLDERNAMLKSQGGACAICGKVPGENERQLVTDHDHETGEVRGLLCNECNIMLGAAKDNPMTLRSAVDYLEV